MECGKRNEMTPRKRILEGLTSTGTVHVSIVIGPPKMLMTLWSAFKDEGCRRPFCLVLSVRIALYLRPQFDVCIAYTGILNCNYLFLF